MAGLNRSEDEGARLSDATPGFECRLHREGDVARVVAVGELDAGTADLLDERVAAALERGPRRLVLDLSELTFMASAGLRLVLRLAERAQREGFELGVVPGPEQVQRVFELTNTHALVPWSDA